MSVTYPTLGEIWPYTEASVPPELAGLRVDAFFADPAGSSLKAAQWSRDADPEAAPRSSYALRLRRAGGQGELSVWKPDAGVWEPVRQFPVPDRQKGASIIELFGIVLGNVASVEALNARLKLLLGREMAEMKTCRILSKILGVASIITLFFAVRNGVESHSLEPFALIFVLALGIGLLAAGLRVRCKVLSQSGLARMREQFRFEYRPAEHAPLTVNNVSTILRENDRNREEEAVFFGFLLLLCFVYFISPLVVVAVVVALVIVTLITANPSTLRAVGLAMDRSENRLEHAYLSFRSGHDLLSPPALRRAKRQVLRDRLQRYGDIMGKVRETQSRARLSQDIGLVVAFGIIFSAYAFPIAAGVQKSSIVVADSLVSTSLFSVAPVVVLLSISKTTAALALVLNRRLARLAH